MAGTKIKDATTTLSSVSANLDDYYLALGKSGETTSIKILVSELKNFFNVTLDKIVEGDSSVEVVDSGSGIVNITIDGTLVCAINGGSILPNPTSNMNLGASGAEFNDIWLTGGIKLGSDATGDIYYNDGSGNLVRLPAGTAGQQLIMGASVPAWGTSASDFVPSYFVTTWTALVAAYDDIAANRLAGTVAGGNIYMAGTFAMASDVSWDLTNVKFYGDGANWNCLNTNSATNNPIINKKVTITAGNPTFYNIQFLGSAGSITNVFSTYDSRELFKLTGSLSGEAQDILFDTCTFGDIVGGTGTNNVIEIAGIPANLTSIISFKNCTINSHNNEVASLSYNGFTIAITGTYSGNCDINIHNQVFNNRALDIGVTSTVFVPKCASTGGGLSIDSDETAQLDSSGITGTYNRRSPMIDIKALTSGTISDTDRILISDTSDDNNVKYITAVDLKTYINTP